MTRLRIKTLLLFFIAALLLTMACTQEPPASRQDVLVSVTDSLIVPRFQSVAAEMGQLREELHALCRNATPEKLSASRAAWSEARAPWMRSQALWFGPVMDRRSRTLVDWSPVDPERIEATLAKRDSISPDDVREFFGSTQRGLGAVEYVIFGEDDTVLGSIADPGGIRCQYLTALGDVIADEMDSVLSEWTGDGSDADGYAGYFKGTAGVALVDQQAVDELVRTSVFIARSIADMKLGKALGADGGEPDPSAIPGTGGHHAVADLRNQVQGMQDVYLGSGAEGALGVSALVHGVSQEADTRMRGHFEATLAAIGNLEEPLRSTILDDPGPARAAHRQIQELQRALNTEVVSLLGVTVGFADTDGDGG